MIKYLLLYATVVMLAASHVTATHAASLFGPSDYDECILENMKGVTSDRAAMLIHRSCARRFPETAYPTPIYQPSPEIALPAEVIDDIDTKLFELTLRRPDGRNHMSIEIYNGNADWEISSLVIRIHDQDTGEYRDYEIKSSLKKIYPLTSESYRFTVVHLPENLRSSIVGGVGIKR